MSGTSKDGLGDRMKSYECRYTDQICMPMLPIVARLDGRAFHSFTKDLKRPYDESLSKLMIETMVHLVKETDAQCGYTQSDEISLVWRNNRISGEIFFGGKLHKIVSVLAAIGTAYFNKHMHEHLPSKVDETAIFDCRVFQVPNENEAINYLIWREQDATRNSIQMAARSVYSHSDCVNKNTSRLQDMLHRSGINWNDYPASFKRGTYVRRRRILRAFSSDEMVSLPEKHSARQNPDHEFYRTLIEAENLPILTSIENRVNFMFDIQS